MNGAGVVVRPAGLWMREGRLLTMRYTYERMTRFNLPGGKPDPGETLPRCLEREFAEELGVSVRVGGLVRVVETHAGGRDVVHLLFALTGMEGEPVLNPAQTRAEAVVWLTPEEVGRMALYPADGAWLGRWMAGAPASDGYGGWVAQDWA